MGTHTGAEDASYKAEDTGTHTGVEVVVVVVESWSNALLNVTINMRALIEVALFKAE